MTYGMLASQSCLLTDLVDQLHENSKKVNSVERLTRHLNKGIPKDAQKSYLTFVRDGSKSTNTKTVFEKGYHVTEACVLTGNNHPISIFSRIHSSKEKNDTSTNDVTFSAMERGASLFGKATFVMDRGYDDNKMFLKLDALKQDYIIRLKSNRKFFYHNKWVMATELRNRRKGKVRMPLYYKGKTHDAYLSHVKVQITASKKDICTLKIQKI